MERHKVVARQPTDCVSGARTGHAVGMEAEDEPLNHQVGHRLGIFGRDFQRRQRLLPLALDFRGNKRRPPGHVGGMMPRPFR